jgi:hypothetical protein
MFSTKKPAVPVPEPLPLSSGVQYALDINFIGSTAPGIAKGINKHLQAHPDRKVIAITSVDKQGAVVVFEVK